jgi:DsbC/DsbD-like thiol-disulfide interchange protein
VQKKSAAMTQNIVFDIENKSSAYRAIASKCSVFAGSKRETLAHNLRALEIGAGLAALALAGAAVAQPSLGADTVSWSASGPAQGVKPGGRITITLRGAVQSGWHVYGLQQLPDGPTPLRVALDASDIASADGKPSGSPATKLRDPSFNLETQFYEHDFTVTAPVRIGAHAAAGQQQIPVSVRFQTCNGHICQPPKTARLFVPVTIRANG